MKGERERQKNDLNNGKRKIDWRQIESQMTYEGK